MTQFAVLDPGDLAAVAGARHPRGAVPAAGENKRPDRAEGDGRDREAAVLDPGDLAAVAGA